MNPVNPQDLSKGNADGGSSYIEQYNFFKKQQQMWGIDLIKIHRIICISRNHKTFRTTSKGDPRISNQALRRTCKEVSTAWTCIGERISTERRTIKIRK